MKFKWISWTYSVTETEPSTTNGDNDDQALLERLAKREERRQKRMKEAMERQKELDSTAGATISTANCTDSSPEEESSISSSNQQQAEAEKPAEEEAGEADTNSCQKEEEDKKEEEEVKWKGFDSWCLMGDYSVSICVFTIDRNLLRNQEQRAPLMRCRTVLF